MERHGARADGSRESTGTQPPITERDYSTIPFSQLLFQLITFP